MLESDDVTKLSEYIRDYKPRASEPHEITADEIEKWFWKEVALVLGNRITNTEKPETKWKLNKTYLEQLVTKVPNRIYKIIEGVTRLVTSHGSEEENTSLEDLDVGKRVVRHNTGFATLIQKPREEGHQRSWWKVIKEESSDNTTSTPQLQ